MAENLRQVRNARAFADKVIVSLHCHDLGGPTLLIARRRTEVDDLADFAIDFGRRAIEAGADIFVAHGPQVPLAVELYKRKPMLHGGSPRLWLIRPVKSPTFVQACAAPVAQARAASLGRELPRGRPRAVSIR